MVQLVRAPSSNVFSLVVLEPFNEQSNFSCIHYDCLLQMCRLVLVESSDKPIHYFQLDSVKLCYLKCMSNVHICFGV